MPLPPWERPRRGARRWIDVRALANLPAAEKRRRWAEMQATRPKLAALLREQAPAILADPVLEDLRRAFGATQILIEIPSEEGENNT